MAVNIQSYDHTGMAQAFAYDFRVAQVFEQMVGYQGFLFSFKMEGYFHLLEHEELNEARQSSRNAMWIAIAAVTISGLLSVASIPQSAL